ncbi:MAG: hypothetical protein EB015_17510 [Methylocystaceae bacterium]|jgi:hypothetical protein|nr:hypothetical protein [Methylocystaceae bacterium]
MAISAQVEGSSVGMPSEDDDGVKTDVLELAAGALFIASLKMLAKSEDPATSPDELLEDDVLLEVELLTPVTVLKRSIAHYSTKTLLDLLEVLHVSCQSEPLI